MRLLWIADADRCVWPGVHAAESDAKAGAAFTLALTRALCDTKALGRP